MFVESNSKTIIEDPEETANKFNDYFINIGPNLAKKIKYKDNDTFEKYLSLEVINQVSSLMLSRQMNLN